MCNNNARRTVLRNNQCNNNIDQNIMSKLSCHIFTEYTKHRYVLCITLYSW